jgi:tellurite resistance protein TerC
MTLFWVLFLAFVLAMLVLDLGVFHRKAHVVGFKEALRWSAFWISLAGLFAGLVYFWRGGQPTLEFVTGYLIELSLSVDNLFVFLMLFAYFRVPGERQHAVLFWGIVGALVMRAAFIAAGVALIQTFHWVIYLFGAILIWSGVKLFRSEERQVDPERNPVLRLFRRWMPITEAYVGGKFFLRREGRAFATPLFVVLLVVETTDLMFAVDSIPAILAITRDPFIVYTSNVFAILGLRSLYFSLAGMMTMFHYLHYGLSIILIFVGLKMLASGFFPIPILVALGVVAGVLVTSVLASVLFPKKQPDKLVEAVEQQIETDQ